MPRKPDEVKIEVVGANGQSGVIDNFTSFSITNDITQPSEASFEFGDDGSFQDLASFTAPGSKFKVFVNGLLRLTGRVEFRDVPFDASAGSVIRFTVKTLLSDAMFASAKQGTKVKDVSVKEFILGLYSHIGFTESDFVFDPAAARDLMTGRVSKNKGTPQKIELEKIKVDEAQVKPPETIYAAADRHLRRHGLMHWDSPDGKIVVSAPNDTQEPLYYIRCRRGRDASTNNVEGITRTVDYSGIPSILGMFGVGGKRNYSKSRVASVVFDQDVIDAGFNRHVTIIAEGIKTPGLAEQAARREMSARSKRKDAFDVSVDGLSWWNGDERVPFGIDTTADVQADVAGGLVGAYYCHRVELSRDASSGDNTKLTLLKAGVWDLGAIL
jgi:prophage tail gpP-like protein